MATVWTPPRWPRWPSAPIGMPGRMSVGLSEIYAFMDRAVAEQLGPDHFVTAQMTPLDTATGRFQWANAGHPAPPLIRQRRVVRRLHGPTTLPVGFGGHEPLVSELDVDRGDRIMCFTDGLVEEHLADGAEFGEEQLIRWVDRVEGTAQRVPAVARSLSHALQLARGGVTTDDATLPLIEWLGPGRAGRGLSRAYPTRWPMMGTQPNTRSWS